MRRSGCEIGSVAGIRVRGFFTEGQPLGASTRAARQTVAALGRGQAEGVKLSPVVSGSEPQSRQGPDEKHTYLQQSEDDGEAQGPSVDS